MTAAAPDPTLPKLMRRTAVVEGPLAVRLRRLLAARRTELGLQIMTLPAVAERLAGGFCQMAGAEDVEPAVRHALDAGGFAELDPIRTLPGMVRAVSRTLRKIWNVDLDLQQLAHGSARLNDLALIESRVRGLLRAGVMLPRELRARAIERAGFAPVIIGPLTLDGLTRIPPLWHPLLLTLHQVVDVEWSAPSGVDHQWFPGRVTVAALEAAAVPSIVVCADPRGEAVEALRWLRGLLASGRAAAADIAIAAPSPDEWDSHFLALATDADLPLHFSHGLPAIASRDGQRCAALADILLNGLSQDRVRRLLRLVAGEGTAIDDLPEEWVRVLPRGAALLEFDQWRNALQVATEVDPKISSVAPVLMPILSVLNQGTAAAEAAGALVLRGRANRLWGNALRAAPAAALDLTLRDLRIEDGRDPGNSAVWCPAAHLAGGPRPFVRLLGLTSRAWPRQSAEDPLLPDHVISRTRLDPDPITAQDRRSFGIVSARAMRELVLSRSRRDAQNRLLAPSPLLPSGANHQVLARARIAEHAFSEADRLLARPDEAAQLSQMQSALACWRSWRHPQLTRHDGLVRANHPVIERALATVQSATSVRCLLRDPLGFVWRYALGWQSTVEEELPLTLDPQAFGILVHDLLRRSVDILEQQSGFGRAPVQETRTAINAAVAAIERQWPLERSVPPLLLWQHTLGEASELAFAALTLDPNLQAGTRSWTEVPFGLAAAPADSRELPWDPCQSINLPGTGMSIRGRIDRLDLREARDAVRVTDYKSGKPPAHNRLVVLDRGVEVQRAIYSLATRQLLPDVPRIASRLIYLAAPPKTYQLRDDEADAAISALSDHVTTAAELLRAGTALPGPDAKESYYDLRIALPASAISGYFRLKQAAFSRALGSAERLWSAP